ncbi:dimethylarginine dimethylaminohydrolase family protein [Solicola gregarius]|uniref:Arginine deiminase family protein n=1 Tax=Solicola gregarius TaxID=2908642 RepID=A0AA46TKT5_9ACTN|nr:arginine deiminase family protein [Solicola gregarius]UYM07149.1 arginine deiminase family protein [Solicola gregarius]
MNRDGTLAWGHHYAMVTPEHYRIEYDINPFMNPADQPDPVRAREQWDTLVATLRALGARVDVLGGAAGSPDMVYAMNLGLAVTDPDDMPRVVMSHMRFAERRAETPVAEKFFAGLGFASTYIGRSGVGGHFESGDAFPYADALLVGHGKRSDEVALKALATELDVRVRALRIVHASMYHLDLAFCPLDARTAFVCPDAFDAASARALLESVPQPIVLSVADALTFCANSVVVGRTVVMPACPAGVRRSVEAAGFEIVELDLSEFHLGGGSIRCMTNPLDIVIGRDLPGVPGGELVLA